MKKILFIEDSEMVISLVKRVLEGIEVVAASTLKEARKLIHYQVYDLVLIDVNLPDGNGFEIFSEIKNHPSYQRVPSIFLTGEASEVSQVMGYSLGADDYIVKPFNSKVFRANILSKMNLQREKAGLQSEVVCGDLFLDSKSLCAYILEGQKKRRLDLTPIEFKLLFKFVTNPDRIFSREKLINSVWGDDINIFDRVVDQHISSLRKKVGESLRGLCTVYGEGYRFSLVVDQDLN